MLLEDFMQCFCIISHKPSLFERRFCDIQIVIITNFVVISSVSIKKVDCIYRYVYEWQIFHIKLTLYFTLFIMYLFASIIVFFKILQTFQHAWEHQPTSENGGI